MRAEQMGRTSPSGDEVWVIATPHYLEDWVKPRYGKSRSRTLLELLGSWRNGSHREFYESMLDAPVGQTMYAVVRSRRGLKPIAFIYFRNIRNESRGNRRELELISVTPPVRGQTEGWNLETMHHHAETECWAEICYRSW